MKHFKSYIMYTDFISRNKNFLQSKLFIEKFTFTDYSEPFEEKLLKFSNLIEEIDLDLSDYLDLTFSPQSIKSEALKNNSNIFNFIYVKTQKLKTKTLYKKLLFLQQVFYIKHPILVEAYELTRNFNFNRPFKYLTPSFWLEYTNIKKNWNYLEQTTLYDKDLFLVEKDEEFALTIDFKVNTFLKNRNAKIKLVKINLNKLKKRSFLYKNLTLHLNNVYAKIPNQLLKNRYTRKIFKKDRTLLKKNLYSFKNQDLRRKTLTSVVYPLSSSLAHFSRFTKNKKDIRKFILNEKRRTTKKFTNKNIKLNPIIHETSFSNPLLEPFNEFSTLFEQDSAFGQSFNLRLQSNPDFFWDEWDASFLSQQNGFNQDDENYEDDYLGENRFFSPAVPGKYSNPTYKTREDSYDRQEFTKDFPIQAMKSHNKSFFDLFQANSGKLNSELHYEHREYPDWFGVPGYTEEKQEEILVGDGPLNINKDTLEKATNFYNAHPSNLKKRDDLFDSTLLYDWYTLQRVNSAFSNRVALNIDDFFITSNIGDCEEYFFRQIYREKAITPLLQKLENPDMETFGLTGFPFKIPYLNSHWFDPEKINKNLDFFVESTKLSLSGSSSGVWRERFPRVIPLKLFDFFQNYNLFNSRSYFYGDRELNKKFSKRQPYSTAYKYYNFYDKDQFNLIFSFFISFFLIFIVSIYTLLRYSSFEYLNYAFIDRPYSSWDENFVPNVITKAPPVDSKFGGFKRRFLMLIKKLKEHQSDLFLSSYEDFMRSTELGDSIDYFSYRKLFNKAFFIDDNINRFFEIPNSLKRVEESSLNFDDTEITRKVKQYKQKKKRLQNEDTLLAYDPKQKLKSKKNLLFRKDHLVNRPDLIINPDDSKVSFRKSFLKNEKLFNKSFAASEFSLFKNSSYREKNGNMLSKIYQFSSVRSQRIPYLLTGNYGLTTQTAVLEHSLLADVTRIDQGLKNNRILSFFSKPEREIYHKNYPSISRFLESINENKYGLKLKYMYMKKETTPVTTSFYSSSQIAQRGLYKDIKLPSTTDTYSPLKSKYRRKYIVWDRISSWDSKRSKPFKYIPLYKFDYKGDDEKPVVQNYSFLRWLFNVILIKQARFYNINKDYSKPTLSNHDLVTFVAAGKKTLYCPRKDYKFFYFDELDRLSYRPRIFEKTHTLPLRKAMNQVYPRSSYRLLFKVGKKHILSRSDDHYIYTLPRLTLRSSSLITEIKPLIFDKVFTELHADRPSVLSKKSYSRMLNGQLTKFKLYGGKTEIKEKPSFSNLKYFAFRGNKSLGRATEIRGLYSRRLRLYKLFKHSYKKRLLSTLMPFGLDIFKINNIFISDEQPFFKKKTFPYFKVNRSILSFNGLQSQNLRWFLLLDVMSNRFQNNLSFTPAHGYRSYFFSKIRLDPVNKVNKALLHVGSNYRLAYMLNIPSFWETHYNSKWIENLPDIYRTTTTPLTFDDELRDLTFRQESYLYFFYFIQELIFNLFGKPSLYLLRNFLFFIGCFYLFYNHYFFLRYKFKSLGIVSSVLNQNLTNSLKKKTQSNIKKSINKFDTVLFKKLLKNNNQLQRNALIQSMPEDYEKGGKTYKNYKLLIRPKTFLNKVYKSALKVELTLTKPLKRKKLVKTAQLNKFKPLTGYSFLWSLPFIKKSDSTSKRLKFYRFNSELLKVKLNSLTFNNSDYFVLSEPSVVSFYKPEIFYNSNQSFNFDLNLTETNTELQKRIFKNRFISSRENDINLKTYKKNATNEYFLNESNEFSKRRLKWSTFISNMRNKSLLNLYNTADPIEFEFLIKNSNRLSYSSDISSIKSDQFICESYTFNRALDELIGFNSKWISINDLYSLELDKKFTEESSVITDIDEDDEDEPTTDDDLRVFEPFDISPLISNGDDEDDTFETIFVDLIYKVSNPDLKEVSVNSLLKGNTSNTLLKRSLLKPVVFSNLYFVQSELTNYKNWRTQSSDFYNFYLPTYETEIEEVINTLKFTPTLTDFNFLTPYSFPRFLKRLNDLNLNFDKFKSGSVNVYDETDPEGFDIKPTEIYLQYNKKRENRLNEKNKLDNLKDYFNEFYIDLFPRKKINYKLNSNLNVSLNFNEEKVYQKYQPIFDKSLLSEDYFSMTEDIQTNFSFPNELNHNTLSHLIEEEDEEFSFFESSFYRWRFLSREYLLMMSRPDEFQLQFKNKFNLTAENFNYSNFLNSYNSSLYYSEFGVNQDLIGDFISDQLIIEEFNIFKAFETFRELIDHNEEYPILDKGLIGEEDFDDVEDNIEYKQLTNDVEIQDSIIDDIITRFLKDIDFSDFSVKQKELRHDLTNAGRSSAVSVYSSSGFGTYPVKPPVFSVELDFNRIEFEPTGSFTFTSLRSYEKRDADFSSIESDLDLIDVIIPTVLNQVNTVLEDHSTLILSDTVEKVIGFLSPETIKRAKKDLLLFRREVLEKKISTTLLNLDSTDITSRDLIQYLVLIKSPELAFAVNKAGYSVIHEIEHASEESIVEVDELLYELVLLLHSISRYKNLNIKRSNHEINDYYFEFFGLNYTEITDELLFNSSTLRSYIIQLVYFDFNKQTV